MKYALETLDAGDTSTVVNIKYSNLFSHLIYIHHDSI